MSRSFILLVVVAVFLAAQVHAEIYKWRDESGVLHFEDRSPASMTSGGGLETKPDTVDPGSTFHQVIGKPGAVRVADQETAYRNAKVEVYLTSWCPYCKKTLEFFQSRGVRVRTYDIDKDSKAARRKDRLDLRKGVPTTIVNGQVIHGYAPGAFESALKGSR